VYFRKSDPQREDWEMVVEKTVEFMPDLSEAIRFSAQGVSDIPGGYFANRRKKFTVYKLNKDGNYG